MPVISATSNVSRDDIAIVGMSCLFPGAPNLKAFWQNIVSKVDATSDPPPDAWDESLFYDPASRETDRVYCKRGGFLGPIARFNPLEHGIVPLAVEGGEPDQWLALQLAHDALRDAGYNGRPPEADRTSVILGKGTYINRGNLSLIQHGLMVEQTIQVLRSLHADYSEADFEAIRDELKRSLPPLNTDTASALIPNIIAGRIANRLDLMGPSYTVDGACASSLIAVEIAMRDLLNGETDLALVGGAQVTTPIPILTLFCQLEALSRRQQLRAFDADADGTVLGEGIGMVVLKRRADAERDGNRIYALIKGVGTASDGRAMSVMAPRLEGEVLAIRRAYEKAGIDPRTIELIEAHGTGTPVGDAVEIQALSDVFGRRVDQFARCAVGTVKTMIGHTMPASGMAGLIKAALAIYHQTLPPTLHCDTPNPRLGLESAPFYVNTETRPWIHGTNATPRRAGVNAFGFGGINAHVILEEHTPSTAAASSLHQDWDCDVCILRAETREALLAQVERVEAYLAADPTCALKDVAYSLNVSPDVGPFRLAIVASTVEDLREKLARAAKRLPDPACTAIKDVRGIYFSAEPLAERGKLAFLFPGEGAQYVNMLADLCIHFPEVRRCFDQIDRMFVDHPRRYLPSDKIFPAPGFTKAERATASQRLWQMDNAIEAVLTANHALFTLLTRIGIRPDVILGHSTGEYAALRAAGIIDFDDEDVYTRFILSLNRSYERELAQDGVPRAALLAIGADPAHIAQVIVEAGGQLYVAMSNCPHQTVVAGDYEAVARAAEAARARGFIHEMLPFDRAYHTPLFETYSEGLRRIYAELPIGRPEIETYSCTSVGLFPHEREAILKLALDHWVKPVRFIETIEAMYEAGVRIFVEAGPKGNLTAFVDDILGSKTYLAVPANVARRSGIAGLNHMVGMLAVNGVPMDLAYLYERRAPRALDLDAEAGDTARLAGARKPGDRKLATGWPPLSLSAELAERLRDRTRPPSERAAALGIHAVPPAADAHEHGRAEAVPATEEGPEHTAAETGSGTPGATSMPVRSGPDGLVPEAAGAQAVRPYQPVPHVLGNGSRQDASGPRATTRPALSPLTTRHSSLVMHAYLEAMDQFVSTQEQLMTGFVQAALRRRAASGRTGAHNTSPIDAADTLDERTGL